MPWRCSLRSGAALMVVFAASGWAAPETQTIQIEQTLQIPGATLKAGEYTFSIEDRMRDRAILRITAADSDKHYLLLTAPSDKLGGAGANGLVFFRSEAGNKEILRGWACPGCTMPLELVYPKAEAAKITQESGEAVLAVDPEYDKLPTDLSADDMKVVTLWLLSPKRITANNRGQGVAAVKYAGVETPPVETAQTQAPAAPAVQQPRMPKTATNTFELALWGLLLTAAGLGLAASRRRAAG